MDYNLMKFESDVIPYEEQFGDTGRIIDGQYQYDGTGLWAIMDVVDQLPTILDAALQAYIDISEKGIIPSIEDIIDDVIIIYLEQCYQRAEFDFMDEPEWENEEFRDQVISDYICEADYDGLYDDFIKLVEDQLMYLNVTFTKEDEKNSYCPLIINDAQMPLLLNPFEGSLELYGR